MSLHEKIIGLLEMMEEDIAVDQAVVDQRGKHEEPDLWFDGFLESQKMTVRNLKNILEGSQ